MKAVKDKWGVTIIWRGIAMCVEFPRGVQASLKRVLTPSMFIIAAKIVNSMVGDNKKTVCDAISQLKVDRKASVCKTGIYNTIFSPSEQDQVVQLILEKCQVACK